MTADPKAAAARRLARGRVTQLRAQLKAARAAQRARLKELRAEVKARRVAARESSKRHRAAMIERHRAERDKFRQEVKRARANLRDVVPAERVRLALELKQAIERLNFAKRELAWVIDDYRKGRVPRGLRGLSAAERLAHQVDEAATDLPTEEERGLLRSLVDRRAIKSSPRRSLSEAFFEYIHDHPHVLSELRHAQELADLERLEQEEREAYQDARPRRRGARRATVAAAAAGDEWGGL